MATYKKSGWPGSKPEAEKEEGSMKSKWLERIEITIPIIELIDEKFFGATQYLTRGSLVFGSIVPAAILGEQFSGDLDIAVSINEHSEIISNISSSPKWVSQRNSPINAGGYKGSNLDQKVKQIANFTSFGGKKIQVIVSKSCTENAFEDALTVVRGVDFSCCALAVDPNGNIFEAVHGAYDDCIAKRLRIIRDKNELSYKSLARRFDKYLKRGFTPVEDYGPLLKELEKTQPPEIKHDSIGERVNAMKKELRNYITLQRPDGEHFVIQLRKILYKKWPGSACSEFTDFIYDTLYNYYREHCQPAIEDDLDVDIVGNDVNDECTQFAFDPYDPGMDWGMLEQHLITSLATSPDFWHR